MPTKAKLVNSIKYLKAQKKDAGLRITKDEKKVLKYVSFLDQATLSVLNAVKSDDLAGKVFCLDHDVDHWEFLDFSSMGEKEKRSIVYVGFEPQNPESGQKYLLVLNLCKENTDIVRLQSSAFIRHSPSGAFFEYDFDEQHWNASSGVQFIDEIIGNGGSESELVQTIANVYSTYPYLLDEESVRTYLEDNEKLIQLHRDLNGFARFQVMATGSTAYSFLIASDPTKQSFAVRYDEGSYSLYEMMLGEDYQKEMEKGNFMSGCIAPTKNGSLFISFDPVLSEEDEEKMREKLEKMWG